MAFWQHHSNLDECFSICVFLEASPQGPRCPNIFILTNSAAHAVVTPHWFSISYLCFGATSCDLMVWSGLLNDGTPCCLNTLEFLWDSLDVRQAHGEHPGGRGAGLHVPSSLYSWGGWMPTSCSRSRLGPSWCDPLRPVFLPYPTPISLLSAAESSPQISCDSGGDSGIDLCERPCGRPWCGGYHPNSWWYRCPERVVDHPVPPW